MASKRFPNTRRSFLKSTTLAGLAAPAMGAAGTGNSGTGSGKSLHSDSPYPRTFTGPRLAMLAFPLGGVGAGSISLGGRGQLRDWEISNRADKGNSPDYAFPSIWVQAQGQSPISRVLEARILPPYEGQDGLGSRNAPGLARLEGATFTGEFPIARIDFHDRHLPVQVRLEAGTPFIPLDAEESGLPVTVLRYWVRNPGRAKASVSIAYSIQNPVVPFAPRKGTPPTGTNEIRQSTGLSGLLMVNPALDKEDQANGSFALCVLGAGDGKVSLLRGWPAGRWWNSAMLFWDDFSADGELGPEPETRSATGAICLKREIPPSFEAEYTFLLAWHFPNRTPERCGWTAPKGREKTIIGNHYAKRFGGAWEAAEYAATTLPKLEERTRKFTEAVRESTLPAAIKEAAMANLSTLVTTTCFRTADGEFHGFEGVNDKIGCCYGNCTHVWNYETATAHLFPSLSHSLRRAAFGYSMDERGAIYFRQLLPDGIERSGFAAADGQMGQIIKTYLDWQLSGDMNFLREFWPLAKRALEFAWLPGGWDADRDGVLEGVQHNTYDVEFYGPNPQCGIYYLGALRAAEEMARAMNDSASAAEYRRLFESGSRWIDANLFNGEYYIQKVHGYPADKIAQGLRSKMGADDPENPQFQVGDGCLVDQLVGQYLAEVAGLGPLLKPANILKTLDSVYRYNHKANLLAHQSVQRTFALNNEAAMVICDYGTGKRPHIPFPYYAEVMTGFEHSTAAHMLYAGMTDRGLECIQDIRNRYDGIRRNPWDEAECGHHYARAMASWSGLLALSGFRYRGPERHVSLSPPLAGKMAGGPPFRSFWSTATAWGVFSIDKSNLTLHVKAGELSVRQVDFKSTGRRVTTGSALLAGTALQHKLERKNGKANFIFPATLKIAEDQQLTLES